jgi:hypothetical protein
VVGRIKALRDELYPKLIQRCLQEALDVLLAHCRLARRHIVQLALQHPALQLIHQVEQVIERVDDKTAAADSGVSRSAGDDPFQLDGIALHFGRFNGVRDFAVELSSPLPYTFSSPFLPRINPNSMVNQKKRANARKMLINRWTVAVRL